MLSIYPVIIHKYSFSLLSLLTARAVCFCFLKLIN